MKIEMRDQRHLWITYDPTKGDPREIIIDEEKRDIRICDGKHVIKVRFNKATGDAARIQDILVDDVFVYPPGEGNCLDLKG